MTKRAKWIYIIGSIVIIIIAVSIILLALFAGGLLNPKKTVIILASGSETFLYDGSAHTNGEWELAEGSLPTGQSIRVEFSGSRTDAGTSENSFVAQVKSESGADVTGNFTIEYRFGSLTVNPLPVSVSTFSGTKVYDGLPLTCQEWEVTSETKLLRGHTVQRIVMPAERTTVGITENYVSEIAVTDGDRDVTLNYRFTYHPGELTVTPRNLTVRSGSAEKDYDGTPLTCADWNIVSVTKPLAKHEVVVGISGVRVSVGESENTIAEVRILDGEEDVTINYAITRQAGALVVKGSASGEEPGEAGMELDTSGMIGGGSGGGGILIPGNGLALKVNSDVGGMVYLRLMSFGDYLGRSWAKALDYPGLLDNAYSLNYLTGIALQKSGYESARIRLDSMGGDYVLPYYMDTERYSDTVQTSDVWYRGNSDEPYALYYFPYDFVGKGRVDVDLGGYTDEEAAYRAYVRSNYLAVPASTQEYLNALIAEQDFQRNDRFVVEKVAKYIQKAAQYNSKYDPSLDAESDIVVSFLRDYKEGICQHYASAATMLYRALGIPARYTIGYAGNTFAGAWTEFKASNAHAWVEVYIEGMGWTEVEVTGAGSVFDDGDTDSPEAGADVLRIKPVNEFMKYDGVNTLTPSGKVQGLSRLLEKGYTYEAKVSGSRRDAGVGVCSIASFTLRNSAGEDVTDRFRIVLSQGKLQVYLQEIAIVTPSAVKIYDGTALTNGAYEMKGKLLSGHSAAVKAVGSRTDVGRSINAYEIAVTDTDGKDVTSYYKVNADYGVLEVTPRQITVVAGSAETIYSGQPLTCSNYWIDSAYDATLPVGHTATVTVAGSQTSVGRSDNIIDSVIIVDAAGKDVTANYGIVLISGVLTVHPDI